VKRYAIFFPQFHSVDVNDKAWGYGFTDWSLVAVANAFNYWTRRAPAAGFYDLSDAEVVRERIEAASNAGLDGFGIYHYRFDDGPELAAVERYLRDHNDLPSGFQYFLIWANENWSKRWAGQDTNILKTINARPSREEVRAHVEYLAPLFGSKSYTRWRDRPVFVVYRPEAFKNSAETIALYREEFFRAGQSPVIGYFLKSPSDREYSRIFDFCYFFEPRLYFNWHGVLSSNSVTAAYKYLLHLLPYSKVESLSSFVSGFVRGHSRSYEFADFLSYFVSDKRKSLVQSMACPVQNILSSGWNNAPRYRSRFTELTTPNAREFSAMLSAALDDEAYSKDIPLLVNAWNEWSEGAAIEECSYLGTSLLSWYVG
jgi:hypothetical protein